MEVVNPSEESTNNSTANSSTVGCELCEIPYIHKNDFENHVKSRGHQRRLREEERKRGNVQELIYECEHCNGEFKGEETYKAHLGSKTHRRNLREGKILRHSMKNAAAPEPFTSAQINRASRRFRRLGIGEQLGEAHTDFIRQKYKTRCMKVGELNYKDYVYSLTAYLSLRLALDPTIDDFMISVNDRKWDMFGDIVVHVFYKNKEVVYAIQCKKVTEMFKQIDHLEEAKIYTSKQYQWLGQLKDAGKSVTDTRFAIFTTCSLSSNFSHSVTLKPDLLNKWLVSAEGDNSITDATVKVKSSSKKNDMINVTSDPENIYSFSLSENENCRLPHLFLYTNQRIFPSMLNQLLKQKFDNYPEISGDYMKYIERWIDGKLGGNYKLKKRDVVLRIGEILLAPYIVFPKKVHSKHDMFAVWNQVINSVDLTVVKNELFTISKICQPLNMIIEETLKTSMDPITRSIHLEDEALKDLSDPIRSYFFEVAQDRLNDIPLHLVYNIFWKAGRIPLLMSTEDKEEHKGFILDVILFMKQMGVHKKFLIKSADLNLSRYKESLKIFTCLEDVQDLIDWNEVRIRVSDSFQLTLSTIRSSDPFFFKWVTPNMFFDISVGKYSLKPSHALRKTHAKKDVLKIILDDNVKDTLEYHLYPEFSEADSSNFNETRLRGVNPGIL